MPLASPYRILCAEQFVKEGPSEEAEEGPSSSQVPAQEESE